MKVILTRKRSRKQRKLQIRRRNLRQKRKTVLVRTKKILTRKRHLNRRAAVKMKNRKLKGLDINSHQHLEVRSLALRLMSTKQILVLEMFLHLKLTNRLLVQSKSKVLTWLIYLRLDSINQRLIHTQFPQVVEKITTGRTGLLLVTTATAMCHQLLGAVLGMSGVNKLNNRKILMTL